MLQRYTCSVKTYLSKVGEKIVRLWQWSTALKTIAMSAKLKMQRCNHARCRISRVMQTGKKKACGTNSSFTGIYLVLVVTFHVLSHIRDVFGIVEESNPICDRRQFSFIICCALQYIYSPRLMLLYHIIINNIIHVRSKQISFSIFKLSSNFAIILIF